MVERAGKIGFPPVARIARARDIPDELAKMQLLPARPVLVLVGGAGGMDQDDVHALDAVLRQAVLPAVDRLGAAVVDGGTDSGVMRVIGRARAAAGATFPLVGVAAEGTVVVPAGARPIDDAANIETNHTHLVLVPGRAWGAESPWIAQVADVLAAGKPSVTLLVNGGEIAYDDVRSSLERHRPVMVLAGTGRTADAIASARDAPVADPRAARIARSRLTTVVSIQDIDRIRNAVLAALT
jgi:hypothetical protein